jgi:hypothetical protein
MAEHRDGDGVQARTVAFEEDAQAGDITGLRSPRERAVVETRHAAILLVQRAAVIRRDPGGRLDAAAKTMRSRMTC